MNKKIILTLLIAIISISSTFAANTNNQNYQPTNKATVQISASKTSEESPIYKGISCENLDYHIDKISQALKQTKINNQASIKNILIKTLKKYLNNVLQCDNYTNPELIEEELTCIFDNSITIHTASDAIDIAPVYPQINKCYAQNSYGTRSCEGEYSCKLKVIGKLGEELELKSSCGSKASTTINGNNKNIDLNCNNIYPINPKPIQACSIIDCAQGYYHQYYGTDKNNCPIYKCETQNPSKQSYRGVIYQCKNGEQTRLRNITSCKPYSTRKKYVNQYCNGSIVNFETIDQCTTYK